MVSLDEGRFPTLELNNRRLSVKNSFCRKNGVYTRSVVAVAAVGGSRCSFKISRYVIVGITDSQRLEADLSPPAGHSKN